MVNKERLDILLQEVIQEARALKIPVSSTIEKNVIVNGRPKKRFGCCRKSRNGFEIEVSRFLLDEAGCSEKIVKGVLAHEVLHTCRDCYEHGMLWKSYAGQMNKAYGYQIKSCLLYTSRDLGEAISIEEIAAKLPASQVIEASLLKGQGITEIEDAVEDLVYGGEIVQKESMMVNNVRHIELLQQAVKSLTDALQDVYKRQLLQ